MKRKIQAALDKSYNFFDKVMSKVPRMCIHNWKQHDHYLGGGMGYFWYECEKCGAIIDPNL